MAKISVADGLAMFGIAMGIVLVVLDKAGKLKGAPLVILLGVAALMLLPLALGNSFVTEAPSVYWKWWRGGFFFCVVAFVYAALAIWIETGVGGERQKSTGALSNNVVNQEAPQNEANEHSKVPPAAHLSKPHATQGQENSGRVNSQAGNITQGPGSITQIGGTGNTATVNNTYGTISPRITPENMAVITKYLAGAKKKAKIKITADQNSNLTGVAEDFYETFKDAGWEMQDAGVDYFIGFAPPGKRFAGVIVTLGGEQVKDGETVYFTNDEAIFYPAQVIEQLKLPHILKRIQEDKSNLITFQFEGNLE